MPALRPATAAVRATTRAALNKTHNPAPRCHFSTSPPRPGAQPRYDPPTGWLWGIKPGTKVEREGWEIPFYIFYIAPMVIAGVAYFYRPDTTIQTWALEEARRRLEKEGILEDPFPDHVEPEDQIANPTDAGVNEKKA